MANSGVGGGWYTTVFAVDTPKLFFFSETFRSFVLQNTG